MRKFLTQERDMTRRANHRADKWSRVLGSSFSMAAVVLMMGCTRTSAPPRDTLVVALTAGPSTLDPRFTTDATGSRLAGLLYSSLVRTGPDLEPVGDAAIDWTYQDLTYRFRLRPGLKFSNGRELTTKDIEFSFQQALDPKSPFASSLASIEKVEARYEADAKEVRVKLKHPSATLLADLSSVKFLPAAEVARAGADFGRQPIGTGPFALVKQDANEIVLHARKDHPFAAPKIDKVQFKIIRDDNTRTLKLLKGEIDLAQQELPPAKIAEIEKNKDFVVHKYPGLAMTYLLLNLEDKTLSQLEIRRAMARAINRDEIIKFKLNGLATPATSVLSPVNPYFDRDLPQIPFAPEEARKNISQAGDVGKEFVLKTSQAPTAVENGRIIAKQLEAIGLKVKLQSFEWATFYGDVQKGAFQLATMRWVGTLDPDIYRKAFHSKETPPLGRNRGRYSNPTLDALLLEGARTENRAERMAIYKKAQKIVLDELPIIPLWYDTEVAVAHRRVHGYQPVKHGDYWPLTQVSKD